MRYKPGHKEESYVRILAALGRGFRRHGLGGIGVDGLGKEAGVTSGAIYGHFGSKAEAFKAAALAGLEDLRLGIEKAQSAEGAAWIEGFVDFYLGYKRTCALDDACGLQVLTPEVMRAEAPVRAAYEQALQRVVAQVAKGLPQPSEAARMANAWTFMSLLSGGVTLTRSMADPALSETTANHIRLAALQIARAPEA